MYLNMDTQRGRFLTAGDVERRRLLENASPLLSVLSGVRASDIERQIDEIDANDSYRFGVAIHPRCPDCGQLMREANRVYGVSLFVCQADGNTTHVPYALNQRQNRPATAPRLAEGEEGRKNPHQGEEVKR